MKRRETRCDVRGQGESGPGCHSSLMTASLQYLQLSPLVSHAQSLLLGESILFVFTAADAGVFIQTSSHSNENKTNNNNNMACLQGATWFMSTARVFHFLLPATLHVSSLVFSSLHSSPNLPSCCLSSIDCRYFLSLYSSLTLSCLHVVVLPAHAQSVCDIHHHTKFNGSPLCAVVHLELMPLPIKTTSLCPGLQRDWL